MPVLPNTVTTPPVMYSQPLSPMPSTTAVAPELRTAKRSPARPAANNSPPVAPYKQVLPAIVALCDWNATPLCGLMMIVPPPMPLPT